MLGLPKPAPHPLESWGAVAAEALKHPLKSGVVDIAVGTAYAGLGVSMASPIRVGLGAGLVYMGACELREHIETYRPRPTLPQNSLH